MSRSLLLSTSAPRRLDAAKAWLTDGSAGRGAGCETLLVAPTRGAGDDLLQDLATSGRELFGVHRFTPLQLASELAVVPLAERLLAPMSGLGVEALVARSLSLAVAAEALDYFSPVAGSPGMVRALSKTLRELRLYGIDRRRLASSGPPGRDLARLLMTYEDELRGWALADDAALLELAREVAASGSHRLLGRPLLLLDLALWTPAERDFWSAVALHAPAVLATVPTGDVTSAKIVAEVLGVPAEDLDAAQLPDHAPGSSRLERLRRRVFAPVLKEDPADTNPGEDSSVVLLTAPGEGRECVEIARRILAEARDGLPFDHMAIVLRDPTAYLPLVEEGLRRAGIPAYFTRGTARPDPAGRAFLALLDCASENLSASRFAEYLSLAQVPPLDPDGAPPSVEEVPWVEAAESDQLVFKSLLPVEPTAVDGDAALGPSSGEREGRREQDEQKGGDFEGSPGRLKTPRQWEKLLVDAAVLGGAARWERRLAGLAAELRLNLKTLSDDDEDQRQRLENRLAELSHLERFALPVIHDLAALPSTATWGRWLDVLGRLAERVLRHSERVLEVLAELRPMDRVGPVGLGEVRRVLGERLRMLRAAPPPRRYGHVWVGTIDEVRGRAFQIVFLPGLAEGLFPRRAVEDPLLLDAHRKTLEADLPQQDERVRRERLLLRLAAGAARRRLVVSYPNLDVLQGRSRVPSFYALDVLRAADGHLPDVRELEGRALRESATVLGWPAPRTAEAAVDATEFDLAVLAPLLGRPDPSSRGRGRYLLEVNEALARSLRHRWLRWRKRAYTRADGIVQSDADTLAALARHRLTARPYSPTALQHYAACPYRFLLYSVHKLRPRDVLAPLEQLDPLTRGSLFHEVQFELFGELKERGWLPMRASRLGELTRAGDAVLERVASRYREELAPAIPKVWEREMEGLRVDLRGWIRTVAAESESTERGGGTPWRPEHFELSFGLTRGASSHGPAGHDPASRREPTTVGVGVVGDGAPLRGSIDLVELDTSRGVLRVTDHKTGKAYLRRNLVVNGGETLQPLLYALAAEQILEQPVESGRLFYCTRRGEYGELVVPLTDDTRRRVLLVLEIVDKALREGFLPAAPRAGACRWCDFKRVCGPHEELRTARKKKEQLVPLVQLREMP